MTPNGPEPVEQFISMAIQCHIYTSNTWHMTVMTPQVVLRMHTAAH
jgi:hypothetical protein